MAITLILNLHKVEAIFRIYIMEILILKKTHDLILKNIL